MEEGGGGERGGEGKAVGQWSTCTNMTQILPTRMSPHPFPAGSGGLLACRDSCVHLCSRAQHKAWQMEEFLHQTMESIKEWSPQFTRQTQCVPKLIGRQQGLLVLPDSLS